MIKICSSGIMLWKKMSMSVRRTVKEKNLIQHKTYKPWNREGSLSQNTSKSSDEV